MGQDINSDKSNERITENMNKMLATLEELQRQHINIKVMLVFPAYRSNILKP